MKFTHDTIARDFEACFRRSFEKDDIKTALKAKELQAKILGFMRASGQKSEQMKTKCSPDRVGITDEQRTCEPPKFSVWPGLEPQTDRRTRKIKKCKNFYRRL